VHQQLTDRLLCYVSVDLFIIFAAEI